MDRSRTISHSKKIIGEIGRQESTVGEQLMKSLPGQCSSENNPDMVNEDERGW